MYEQVAEEIDHLEPEYKALSDSELRSKTDFFRDKLQSAISGISDLDDITAGNILYWLAESYFRQNSFGDLLQGFSIAFSLCAT